MAPKSEFYPWGNTKARYIHYGAQHSKRNPWRVQISGPNPVCWSQHADLLGWKDRKARPVWFDVLTSTQINFITYLWKGMAKKNWKLQWRLLADRKHTVLISLCVKKVFLSPNNFSVSSPCMVKVRVKCNSKRWSARNFNPKLLAGPGLIV